APNPWKTTTTPPQHEVEISPCSIQNKAFRHGETITYKLYYNWNFVWLSAGEVTFQVQELDNTYHLSAYGETYKSYEWFYKVRDRYDTYVDKETLLPKTSIRDILEGKYTLYDKTTFDQSENKAYSLRGKTRSSAELKSYPVEGCMHDILSMIYYTRNMDLTKLQPGSKIPLKIFMDEETWPLKLTYRGIDKNMKVKGLGRFDAIQLSPEVIAGDIFDEGTEMNIWVSADANRVPLLIESPLSVGSVKAVLKDYEGLRHELDAQSSK
ncbi:MAG TPA: DUF3108 domain-containing protein, partial [Phaeodactylibacter sp.]|nr:DUF3108 domain-containing protein [Phaeodactylibacter sp.]